MKDMICTICNNENKPCSFREKGASCNDVRLSPKMTLKNVFIGQIVNVSSHAIVYQQYNNINIQYSFTFSVVGTHSGRSGHRIFHVSKTRKSLTNSASPKNNKQVTKKRGTQRGASSRLVPCPKPFCLVAVPPKCRQLSVVRLRNGRRCRRCTPRPACMASLENTKQSSRHSNTVIKARKANTFDKHNANTRRNSNNVHVHRDNKKVRVSRSNDNIRSNVHMHGDAPRHTNIAHTGRNRMSRNNNFVRALVNTHHNRARPRPTNTVLIPRAPNAVFPRSRTAPNRFSTAIRTRNNENRNNFMNRWQQGFSWD